MKKKVKYGILNNLLFLLRDMVREYPLLLLYLLLEMTLSVIGPILGLYLPKTALDLVSAGADERTVLYRLGGLGILMTLGMALSAMAERGKYMMYNFIRSYY